MRIDVKALGQEVFAEARAKLEPHVRELGPRANMIRLRLARLEADTQATLEALEHETDSVFAAALVEDLEEALPARRLALIGAIEAELGSAGKALLDSALEIGVRIAIAVARAFVPIP